MHALQWNARERIRRQGRCTASLRQAHAQAVADRLGLRIVVLSTFEESPVIQIDPHGGARSNRILHLSFWAEVRALCRTAMLSPGQIKRPCSLQQSGCSLASAR